MCFDGGVRDERVGERFWGGVVGCLERLRMCVVKKVRSMRL